MRSNYLLLLPLHTVFTNARQIPRPYIQVRDPTFPEDTTAVAFPPSPTTSSPAQILQECLACQVVGQALNVCASISPSFTALDPTAQAQCLCYSSTIWVPNVFDNAVESCANYASTAAPPAYGVLANLENFCENVGNVAVPVTVFTLAPTGAGGSGNGGTGSLSNYVTSSTGGGASASPAMTGYGGAESTGTANSGGGAGSGGTAGSGSGTSNTDTSPTTTSKSSSITTSASKTTSERDLTITVGGASTSKPSPTNVARRVIPDGQVVWLGFAISLLFVFL